MTSERAAEALERIATVLEAFLLPNARSSPYEAPDSSGVTYVDDQLAYEIEQRQLDYRNRTGRSLGAFTEPPSPLDPSGRPWGSTPLHHQDPPEGAKEARDGGAGTA